MIPKMAKSPNPAAIPNSFLLSTRIKKYVVIPIKKDTAE
jgi:hypothetical protein